MPVAVYMLAKTIRVFLTLIIRQTQFYNLDTWVEAYQIHIFRLLSFNGIYKKSECCAFLISEESTIALGIKVIER